MKLRPTELDDATRDYLSALWRSRGSAGNGVFTPLGEDGWGGRVFLGIVPLVIIGLTCIPPAKAAVLPYWQTGLLAVAVLLLAAADRTRRRNARFRQLGAFRFLDAAYLWDVNPRQITAQPVTDVHDYDGQHHFVNGVYVSTTLKLLVQNGRAIPVRLETSRTVADTFLNFLQATIAVRKHLGGSGSSMNPTIVGAYAAQLISGSGSIDQETLNLQLTIPQPEPAPTMGISFGWLTPWLFAAAAAGIGWFAFPLLDHLIYDQYLYGQVKQASETSFEPLDTYLKEMPNGLHAGEVRALRDDRKYELAKSEASSKRSPSHLREYLAEPENTRHRDAAQQLINVFYDEAIARLKGLADQPISEEDPDPTDDLPAPVSTRKASDSEVFKGLLSLLEALKTSENPVVTVGFHATQDATPAGESEVLEKLIYEIRMEQEPALKDVADRNGGTAILSLGSVFAPEQTSRRESVIMERLKAAVSQVLDADILTLEPAAAGAKPVMEVGYHIRPSGRLYLYTETQEDRSDVVKGLLRGYEFLWTITIRPPGKEQEHVIELPSQPAGQLKYDSNSSDPDWAPYAIILISGFYDMSTQFIRDMGLEPPPAPGSFSFYDAVAN